MFNKLIVAAAGSGKTELIIENALSIPNEQILITTFTDNNYLELRNRFYRRLGYLPKRIGLYSWYSFLIEQCIKPYQSTKININIDSLELTNGLERNKNTGKFILHKEEDVKNYYLTKDMAFRSDKLSELAFRIDVENNGIVSKRLHDIYQYIFIDEGQDLAGYDYELICLFAKTGIKIIVVCDPRQKTYQTSKGKKNKGKNIVQYFQEHRNILSIDSTILSNSHRCISPICDFANMLYPMYEYCNSSNTNRTEHDGVFFVRNSDVDNYLERYTPMQLVYNKNTKRNKNYNSINFGDSKGLSYERVLIYPTKKMVEWINNNSVDLSEEIRAKFYVAVTRAKQSVGIVVDDKNLSLALPIWIP